MWFQRRTWYSAGCQFSEFKIHYLFSCNHWTTSHHLLFTALISITLFFSTYKFLLTHGNSYYSLRAAKSAILNGCFLSVASSMQMNTEFLLQWTASSIIINEIFLHVPCKKSIFAQLSEPRMLNIILSIYCWPLFNK